MILRLVAALFVIGAAAVLAYSYRAELQPANIQALLADNPWAPLVYVLGHIVATMGFFPPRSIIAVAAGAAFGFWAGLALSTIGATAGAVACFALVRYVHRGVFALDGKRGVSWLAMLKKRLEGGGWRGVAFVRLMPLPGTPVNYAFGLTEVSFADYFWGSFLGQLPLTLFCVGIGAVSGQALSGSNIGLQATLIGLAALGASVVMPRLLQILLRLLRRRPPK